MFDMDKMEAGLNELTGVDFEQAENAERMNGNMMPDISFSKSFQARLAAKALNVPIEKVKAAKINEFTTVTTQVSNFLFGNLAETVKTQSKNIAK